MLYGMLYYVRKSVLFLSLWRKGAKTRSTLHTQQCVIDISISSEIVFELLGTKDKQR